jgi:lambda repressor-like predicted transcriptional regulator
MDAKIRMDHDLTKAASHEGLIATALEMSPGVIYSERREK